MPRSTEWARRRCARRAPAVLLLPVLEAPPLRSPINFWNAVLRLDSTLDDRPEEEPVLLMTWLEAETVLVDIM